MWIAQGNLQNAHCGCWCLLLEIGLLVNMDAGLLGWGIHGFLCAEFEHLDSGS